MAACVASAHLCLAARAPNGPPAASEPSRAGPAALSCPRAASEVGSSWESAVEKELLIFQGNFPGMLALAEAAQVGQTGSIIERVPSFCLSVSSCHVGVPLGRFLCFAV